VKEGSNEKDAFGKGLKEKVNTNKGDSRNTSQGFEKKGK
jgi:hypothetical protein